MLADECYVKLNKFTEEELKNAIIERSKAIEKQFIKIFKENKIDLVIPNNMFCLARSLHIGMALYNAIKETGVKAISHHHDFYWEREYFKNPTTEYIEELLEKYYPPKDLDDKMKHVVINKLAKRDLRIKKGLESTVVPNVFEFKAKLWGKDKFNKDFKKDLGVNDNQILILQATRVTNRKAIELAIDLVALLDKKENKEKLIGKRIYDGRLFDKGTEYVLAIVGMHEGVNGYEQKLIKHANELDVKIIIKPEIVDHSRHINENGTKIYSLWDTYVYCDFITYPSIYEGWGNQFLEGLFAKKPQVVFEYVVFGSDIKEKEFNIISLGNTYKTEENGLVSIDSKILGKVKAEVENYLINKKKYFNAVEENFKKGAKYFSMEQLENIFIKLF